MYHIPSIRSKDFVHRAVIIKNETFPIDPEKNCAPRGAIPSNEGGHLLSFTFTLIILFIYIIISKLIIKHL